MLFIAQRQHYFIAYSQLLRTCLLNLYPHQNPIKLITFFHLSDLVHCTNEPNVSIPHLANLLVERSQNANWVVVYKALITTHHLLAYGNEVSLSWVNFSRCSHLITFIPQRFIQYLASSNSSFNLSNFLDKGGVQGESKNHFYLSTL